MLPALAVLALILGAATIAVAPGLSVLLICAALWCGARVSVGAESRFLGVLFLLAIAGMVAGVFLGFPDIEHFGGY